MTRTIEEWDENGDGVVDWGEFVTGWRDKGRRMRDFGTGVGHHGDDEYEYEIHHFEKFHDESEFFASFSFLPLGHSFFPQAVLCLLAT